jgi:hypothetical protein
VREKQKALNAILSDTEVSGPFLLYLRPFSSARSYPVKSTLRGWADRMICGSRWDIETALSFALNTRAPLFAIGDVRGSIGAVKLFVPDDDWKRKFEKLCNGLRQFL